MVNTLKTFSEPMKSMLMFRDIKEFYLCEDSEFEMMLECFGLSTSINERVTTEYFEKLNSNFFLIRKDMFTKKKTKSLFKMLINIRDEIELKLGDSHDHQSDELMIVNNTCNILLIGSV